jgi:hypothetical protein
LAFRHLVATNQTLMITAARGCGDFLSRRLRHNSLEAIPFDPGLREEYALMLFENDDDHDVSELVARLLGETAEFIRRRGFHLVEPPTHGDEPDLVDMAVLTGGLDWDHDLEPRLTRRNRNRRAA